MAFRIKKWFSQGFFLSLILRESLFAVNCFRNKAKFLNKGNILSLMKQYMVDIDLPDTITEEFMTLIPQQREQVNKLMLEGKINSYTLSMDRTKLWIILSAKSDGDVFRLLATFPMRRFMDAKIVELAFHNTITTAFPQISLN